MSEFSKNFDNRTNRNSTNIPNELTLQIVALLRNSLGTQSTITNSENLTLGIKLSDDNYALWATLMRKTIAGRDSHYWRTFIPFESRSSIYTLEQNDQCVFTWLIQNIKSNLVNNVSQYPTAKTLWNGLDVTYGSRTDSLQVFDFHKKAKSLRQGGDTLENCWNILQSIRITIDHGNPNPVKDPKDI